MSHLNVFQLNKILKPASQPAFHSLYLKRTKAMEICRGADFHFFLKPVTFQDVYLKAGTLSVTVSSMKRPQYDGFFKRTTKLVSVVLFLPCRVVLTLRMLNNNCLELISNTRH